MNDLDLQAAQNFFELDTIPVADTTSKFVNSAPVKNLDDHLGKWAALIESSGRHVDVDHHSACDIEMTYYLEDDEWCE